MSHELNNEVDAIKRTFEERHIEFEYYHSREDLINSIRNEIGNYETIGIGNSQTLKALKICDIAVEMGKIVFDKTMAVTTEEIKQLKKNALISDC